MPKIAQTDFTIEWLIEKLKRKFEVKTELKKWNCQRIGMGNGFASTILLVEFDWKDEIELPNSVVLKIPDIGNALLAVVDKSDGSLDIIKQFHHNEIVAYLFLQKLNDHRIPKLYHYENIDSGVPILVMESFHRDSCTATVADGLNLEQVLKVCDTLAKVHVHSLKETQWVNSFMNVRKDFDQTWAALLPLLDTVIIPLDSEYFGEKLQKLSYMFKPEYGYYLMNELHEKMGLPPVLVHGDMWVNNILWEKSPNGKAGNNLLAIVDWQISHAGSCCEDIARLMANSLNGELRRAKTDEILSFYHAKLSEYMRDDPVPFSLEKVKEVYNRVLPWGMMFLLFQIPFFLKSSAFKGENSELYMVQKVNDAKMIIEDVIQLEEVEKCL